MIHNVLLGPFVHANGDGEEIVAIEKTALADEGVQAEIAKLKLPEGTVVISDPWIYGTTTTMPLILFNAKKKYRLRWR